MTVFVSGMEPEKCIMQTGPRTCGGEAGLEGVGEVFLVSLKDRRKYTAEVSLGLCPFHLTVVQMHTYKFFVVERGMKRGEHVYSVLVLITERRA